MRYTINVSSLALLTNILIMPDTHDSSIEAPYFEDFHIGQTYGGPATTVTAGHAALYSALTGDRLRLPLDHSASARATGRSEPLAHPLLAINLAIGQTTWASQRVRANLFYRGLVLRRQIHLGDTLTTTSKVAGLKQNRTQAGKPATGLVVIECTTQDQDGETVLHYWRCPMIPCRAQDAQTGHADDVDAVGRAVTHDEMAAVTPTHWQINAATDAPDALDAAKLVPGTRYRVAARDTVTAAPELVRMTLNIAMAHTDAAHSFLGERLVYGGHTIAVAFAQLTRALPQLITLLAWERCDHVGPVYENDRLRTEFRLTQREPLGGGWLLRLHAETYASRGNPETEHSVLDWQLVVWSM